jgi:hypothetical protein
VADGDEIGRRSGGHLLSGFVEKATELWRGFGGKFVGRAARRGWKKGRSPSLALL